MLLEWRTKQALEYEVKRRNFEMKRYFKIIRWYTY